MTNNQFIQVKSTRDSVVVDTINHIGYLIRDGINLGNYYQIPLDEYQVKRFDATGQDLRFLSFTGIEGDLLDKFSEEYNAVIAAMGHYEPRLVGLDYSAIYPNGYTIED